MSIDVTKLLQQCNKEMQKAELHAGFNNIIRRPNRPVLLVFLGEYRPECIEEVRQTIEMNWPQHSSAIIYKHYENSEQFCAALKEDAEGNIEMEDAVISQCNPQKGFAVSNNVIIGYFLNLTKDAEAFVDILNQPFNPPAGGVITRFLFGMCKFSRNSERKKSVAVLKKIDSLSKSEKSCKTWQTTHVVSIGDFMKGGGVIQEDSEAEGYAIAAELLLIYNSVADGQGKAPILPYVTAENGNFITGAFQRIGKPRDMINKAVIYQYLVRCQELAVQGGEETRSQEEELNLMRGECAKLAQEFFMKNAYPYFPEESDMAGFPNQVSNVQEAGEEGVPDKTYGIWKAYRKLYFEDIVKKAIGSTEQLTEYFECQLSDRYSCAQIRQNFALLKDGIRKNGEDLIHWNPGNNSFLEYGRQAASKVMNDNAEVALGQAIDNLLEGADTYQDTMNRVQKQIQPADSSIRTFYASKADHYLNSKAFDDGTRKEMKRPCTESILKSRILSVYKKMLHAEDELRLPFEQELAKRTNEENANQQIASVLNVTDAEMEKVMRMHLSDISYRIGDYALVNPKEAIHVKQSQCFEVGRTDCLDRVAFYAYNVGSIL